MQTNGCQELLGEDTDCRKTGTDMNYADFLKLGFYGDPRTY